MLFACCLVASLLLTPIVWSHYLVLLFAPLLLHRARLRWLLAASATSWLVAAPVLTRPLLSASLPWHIALLLVGVVALLASLHKASEVAPGGTPRVEGGTSPGLAGQGVAAQRSHEAHAPGRPAR